MTTTARGHSSEARKLFTLTQVKQFRGGEDVWRGVFCGCYTVLSGRMKTVAGEGFRGAVKHSMLNPSSSGCGRRILPS